MKEKDKIGYVYLTTNLVNGKQYVGQHISDGFDTTYKGSGTYIKNALNKYGWDNFKCEIICWCSTQTQLNEAEDNYIKLIGTMVPNGYNLKGGGANGRLSEEARKKASEAMKKYFANEENRKKISEASKGRHHTEESLKKISEAKKKYFANEENRKKQSEAIKGKHRTEETRKKLSEAHKKYFESEEARKKQSENLKKYFESEEARKKQSEAQNKYKKKVFQYTLDGKFVKEWCSLNEIRRVLGYDKSHISACCLGKQKSAYKFIWRYSSEETTL